jgi:hypothetical protein
VKKILKFIVGAALIFWIGYFLLLATQGCEPKQDSGCNCPFTCETEIHTVDGIDYCECLNCEGFER